jgi:hypothetical protein
MSDPDRFWRLLPLFHQRRDADTAPARIATPDSGIIRDAAGHDWTLNAQRQVMLNGAPMAEATDIRALEYHNSTVYAQNAQTLAWTAWSGSTWIAASKPPTPAGPLRALLQVWAEQAALLEADIAQQYDNWFIETCEDWAVPYIGDLIGYTPLHDTGDPSSTLKLEDEALRRVVAPRREVANTIRYRRRKGTLPLLEQIAADVAGWPARAVEFRRQMAVAQHTRHPQPSYRGVALVRNVRVADIGTPADPLPRVTEVRRVSSGRGKAAYGPYQVGLFVARHVPVSVTCVPASCVEEVGGHCFLLNPLQFDIPLYRRGDSDAGMLPGRLTREALTARTMGPQGEAVYADPRLFGESGSVMLWIRPEADAPLRALAPQQVVPANLRDWAERPKPANVALDPERGRLMFPEREAPDQVIASYHEGMLGSLGASERLRRLWVMPEGHAFFPVGGKDSEAHNSVREAIEAWRGMPTPPHHALIEIQDSSSYDEQRLLLTLNDGQTLQIRAAQGTRPLLRIVDYEASRDDTWTISGTPRSELILDGLLIAARRLHVRGSLGSLVLRHCTLVPSIGSRTDTASQTASPSLMMDNAATHLRIQHSIVGAIHVRDNELENEPFSLDITDSVVDGGRGDAILGPGSIAAHTVLSIRRSTVLGRCAVHELLLAEDSLFTGRLIVARRQRGCVRFCYLPLTSRTPRRFECVPRAVPRNGEPMLSPVFVTLRYGQPGYCQLAEDCPQEIWRGASDQGELGVFHNLFQPQREANLRARLAEYVPAAIDVDVIYST